MQLTGISTESYEMKDYPKVKEWYDKMDDNEVLKGLDNDMRDAVRSRFSAVWQEGYWGEII